MSSDLSERLLRWRDHHRQGREVSPEDLCADRPELAPELARLVRQFRAMEALFPLDECETAPVARAQSGYEILGDLGAGGMGVVYRARERDTGRLVALKRMRSDSPEALGRFQQEWHLAQDVRHANLVCLLDLVRDEAGCFFTMELVEGEPFPGRSPAATGPATVDLHSPVEELPPPPGQVPEESTPRLRDLFRQLAAGIQALHEGGILHRDVKPSNALVTAAGRVVLLDFGLAAAADDCTTAAGAGTLLYVAPEQAMGRAERASDWYSFGVMLYQALTGRHPFADTPFAHPCARGTHAPPPPRAVRPDVPDDLSRLCARLLAPRPADRPAGAAVLEALLATEAPPGPRPAAPPATLFLGREGALARLHGHYAAAREGRVVTVLLHGPSGVGKSALAAHFLRPLRPADESAAVRDGSALVLTGRCYERESVPYKALDGLVSSLARVWRKLPADDANFLLPRDVRPLVQVFPVLLRVGAVASATRGATPQDPQEVRRRAFAALGEILARAGDRCPLVVHLDDLQWGDVDSARMLAGLLLRPDPPRRGLLLLAGFRSEERQTSPFLRALLQGEDGPALRCQELSLEVLDPDEALDLARRLLEGTADHGGGLARQAARESGGSPFFLYWLAQAIKAGDEAPSLAGVISRRCQALPPDQRRLLEAVALAGGRLPEEVAFQAAGVEETGRKALIELQAARLLRGGADRREAETYHDRVREAVVAALAAQGADALTDLHRRLAHALLTSGQSDQKSLEMLAHHCDRAGMSDQAAEHYARAAEQAAKALAFDQAAGLYRRSLELRPPGSEEGRRLRERLGEALANAGRGAEAALAYLDAADGAPAAQALDRQRLAAEQYMRAGHIERGLELFRAVLARVGLRYPETPRAALWQALLCRARVWWRGTSFRKRQASEVPPEELTRIELCGGVGRVLSVTDHVRGAAFHARHYLLALKAGEPRQVALAFAWAAIQESIRGGSLQPRLEKLLRLATELACAERDPLLTNQIDYMRGIIALLLGRWQESSDRIEEARRRAQEECAGLAWEVGAGYHYQFTALKWLGQWRRHAREVPPLLREARGRGDLFTSTTLLLHSTTAHLAADRPELVAPAVAEARGQWPAANFSVQHYHALWAEVEAALYVAEPGRGWELLSQRWPGLARSGLLRVQSIRLTMLQLRARCALAAACATERSEQDGRRGLLREAERATRQVERERMGWAVPGAKLLLAGLAAARHDPDAEVRLLGEAAAGFDQSGAGLYAAAARRLLAGRLGGEEGRRLGQQAEAFFAEQEIRNPAGILNVYAPGLPGP